MNMTNGVMLSVPLSFVAKMYIALLVALLLAAFVIHIMNFRDNDLKAWLTGILLVLCVIGTLVYVIPIPERFHVEADGVIWNSETDEVYSDAHIKLSFTKYERFLRQRVFRGSLTITAPDAPEYDIFEEATRLVQWGYLDWDIPSIPSTRINMGIVDDGYPYGLMIYFDEETNSIIVGDGYVYGDTFYAVAPAANAEEAEEMAAVLRWGWKTDK
jgi:hypothetical protein